MMAAMEKSVDRGLVNATAGVSSIAAGSISKDRRESVFGKTCTLSCLLASSDLGPIVLIGAQTETACYNSAHTWKFAGA